jgi:hypothetical protein
MHKQQAVPLGSVSSLPSKKGKVNSFSNFLLGPRPLLQLHCKFSPQPL